MNHDTMFKNFTPIVSLLLFASYTWAQQNTATIAGHVKMPDGRPTSFINVVLENTTNGTTTDASANFQITGLPAGTYYIKPLLLGYKVDVKEIELEANTSAEISFELEHKVNEVSTVEVFGIRDKQPEKLDAITRLPLKPSEQVQSISVISDKLIEQQFSFTKDLQLSASQAAGSCFI